MNPTAFARDKESRSASGNRRTPRPPRLSVVTPALNEAENLPALHARLTSALASTEGEWEWIVIDDHSTDSTFDEVTRLARHDSRVRGVRLARHAGSHAAIACGLATARGRAAIVLAADGQDPPEILPALVEAWTNGAHVVWGARSGADDGVRWTSRLYYMLMRRVVGLTDFAPMGADCVLLDRVVVDAVRRFHEHHGSLFALITWMGFRQTSIPCRREARLRGRSGWTFARKVEFLVDSITSFNYLPIRLMSYLGLVSVAVALVYAVVVIVNAMSGRPPAGWSSLMVVVLLIGGVQMLMLGVLGEYVWRALEESRRRPRYLIEAMTDSAAPTTDIVVDD